MNLTAGGSLSLYGPIDHPLENGKQFKIVSAAETKKKASAFVADKTNGVKSMGWLELADNSRNNHPLDFKLQLDENSLYLWSDGKAYDRDGIGNITWGYLSYFAINGHAHLGAAVAQVFIDQTSKPEWLFSHSVGDRPKDFDAINAGRAWAGERPAVDLSKGWAH